MDHGPVQGKGDHDPQESVNASSSGSTSRTPQYGNREWWVVVLNSSKRGVEKYDVKVKEDTGSTVNWIHPHVIERCKLDSLVEACEARDFQDMNGRIFSCEQRASITWFGRGRITFQEIFFVSSKKAPIQMVLGDEFVTKYGRASEICADAPRTGDARMYVATKLTKEERDKMKENSAAHKQKSAEVIARSQEKASRSHGGETKNKGNSSEKKRAS
ncbi:hypothetical protein JX265_010891 [Neoarthrinium moseri]|uniref:Uncharacterized protein n=1 Tax=Neoarthrinium moseri TaxID=1658444 RepID=A0A9Q0AI35_9PEZI|nr:uncharacterized protein JN550_008998 [Neoarthrinium moseri]KAI1858223.1 hypothetical protein JX265_010891 [Neoarthrinium moseri]KAI1864441.1 hypothetical protein JN550_008998 [Neoarthrinium moseri]